MLPPPFRPRRRPHVEEVGGLPAEGLDDVHGGHGEPGAVDHAADAAIEGDVAELVLRRLHLARIFLLRVAQRGDVFVAEEGVVVKIHFDVERQQTAFLCADEGVEFDERAVLVPKQTVKPPDDGRKIPGGFSFQAQPCGQVGDVVAAQPGHGVDLLAKDFVGVVFCHLFDFGAALR